MAVRERIDGAKAARIMYGGSGMSEVVRITPEQLLELKKPLDQDKVKSRKQGWGSVDYIESWSAIDEANRIFDFNWSRETVYCKEVCRYAVTIGDKKLPGFKVGYEAKVRIEVAGLIKEGTGHGCGTMTDLFDCIESAAKEAESDAMKRALMMFGYVFGLALYDKERRHVESALALEKKEKKEEKKELSPEQKRKIAEDKAQEIENEYKQCKSLEELQKVQTKHNKWLVALSDNCKDLFANINTCAVQVLAGFDNKIGG